MNETQKIPMTKTKTFFLCGLIYLFLVITLLLVLGIGAILFFVILDNLISLDSNVIDACFALTGIPILIFCLFVPGGCLGVFMRKKCMKQFPANLNPGTSTSLFLLDGSISIAALFFNATSALIFYFFLLHFLGFFYIHVGRHAIDIIAAVSLWVVYFISGGCAGLFMRWKYLKFFNSIHTLKIEAKP